MTTPWYVGTWYVIIQKVSSRALYSMYTLIRNHNLVTVTFLLHRDGGGMEGSLSRVSSMENS